MTASLKILPSQFRHMGDLHKTLESVHQESPRSDIFRKRATKPLLNQRHRQKHLNWTVAQWSKVLFSDKSKFFISFGNQGLEEDGRRTESKLLEVQCEVSEVRDDLGCRDVCWCLSIVFYQVQSQLIRLPGDFGALCFHLLMRLSTCPQCHNHFQVLC